MDASRRSSDFGMVTIRLLKYFPDRVNELGFEAL